MDRHIVPYTIVFGLLFLFELYGQVLQSKLWKPSASTAWLRIIWQGATVVSSLSTALLLVISPLQNGHQLYIMRIVLTVGQVFGQVANLCFVAAICNRVVDDRYLGPLLACLLWVSAIISIVLVALPKMFLSVDISRFVPPSLQTFLELSIAVRYSWPIYRASTKSLGWRVSIITGVVSHLMVILPLWVWTGLEGQATRAMKICQLLQALAHGFPASFWPPTWYMRRREQCTVEFIWCPVLHLVIQAPVLSIDTLDG